MPERKRVGFRKVLRLFLSANIWLSVISSGNAVASDRDGVAGGALPVVRSPLTMADSIEMKRLVDTGAMFNLRGGLVLDFSPDGKHFHIVTRRGNVESGLNDYELLLYAVDSVLEFVNDPTTDALPEPAVLFRASTSSNHGVMRQHAIRRVIWLADGKHLLFIADPGDEPAQIHSVNIESPGATRLSNHPRAILDFTYSQSDG